MYPNIGRQFFMIFHFPGKFLYRTCLTLYAVLIQLRIFQAMYYEKKFFILCLGNYCNGDFDVHGAVHRNIIPIVKPTRCTSVSNLFILEWHSTWFGRPFRPSSGVQDCTYSNQADTAVGLLASRQQYLFDICLLLYVQSWTADDGRKDRPNHVECHSKLNKFDTLVHLVGFTVGLL
jgi:hypothetical protein